MSEDLKPCAHPEAPCNECCNCAPLPRKEWPPETEVLKDGWAFPCECPDCNYAWDEEFSVQIKHLKPEVQERLSGGGDERWVLDELKSIVKDLAETDRPEPTKENMWFRNLRVRASKLMPSLESQASGKVKPNE